LALCALESAEQPGDSFLDTTHKSFTWSAGLGLERSFARSWRVGIGYLFTDAGEAELKSRYDDNSLSVDDLFIHQAQLQVTYVLCGMCRPK
jgi:opacity protein-like surface antigen